MKASRSVDFGLEDLVDEDKQIDAVMGTDAYIFGGYEKVSARVINSADKLKVIAFLGAGYGNLRKNAKAAARRGIAVTNAPGANRISVAELAVTLMVGA